MKTLLQEIYEYLKIIQHRKGANHYSPKKHGVYPLTSKKITTSTCAVGEKHSGEKAHSDNSTLTGATTSVPSTSSAVSPSSSSERSTKTSGSFPISSGSGTNEVTNTSNNDKKDDLLDSVTDGEELSGAELLLSDADLLSAEQALDFIEDDTKEYCDCSDGSAGVKAQEGSSCWGKWMWWGSYKRCTSRRASRG